MNNAYRSRSPTRNQQSLSFPQVIQGFISESAGPHSLRWQVWSLSHNHQSLSCSLLMLRVTSESRVQTSRALFWKQLASLSSYFDSSTTLTAPRLHGHVTSVAPFPSTSVPPSLALLVYEALSCLCERRSKQNYCLFGCWLQRRKAVDHLHRAR